MTWFLDDLYDSVRSLVNFRPYYEEGTSVRTLIVADTIEQARHYARVHKLLSNSWKFVDGVNIFDAYPNAAIVCIRTELYRDDLIKIYDYLSDRGRYIEYE